MAYYKKRQETIVGESGGDKPTNVQKYTLFEELDTGDTYYYDGETWQKVGGEAEEE